MDIINGQGSFLRAFFILIALKMNTIGHKKIGSRLNKTI